MVMPSDHTPCPCARVRVRVRVQVHRRHSGPAVAIPSHPLGPLRAKGFRESCSHFLTYLLKEEEPYASEAFSSGAARLLALRGFENCRQLRGVSSVDVSGWTSNGGVQALLMRTVFRANNLGISPPTEVEPPVLENDKTQTEVRSLNQLFA